MGGRNPLVWEVTSTHLGDSLENEPFWSTAIHFFINNPFLERTYVIAIIDYIHNQKYTPQRIPRPDGTYVEGPPPHPNFSMKGRSINRLIREVDRWHTELTGEEGVPLETWPSCGFREFTHSETDAETGRPFTWSVHELRTSAQLQVEGRMMHHCVASYARRCKTGEASIWSIRVQDDPDPESQPRHILTVAVDNKKRTVTQYRGKFNLRPFDRASASKRRRTDGTYLRLLRESARILRLWMDREGLSHE